MHDNQHGNALCKQSTGLRLHRSQTPTSPPPPFHFDKNELMSATDVVSRLQGPQSLAFRVVSERGLKHMAEALKQEANWMRRKWELQGPTCISTEFPPFKERKKKKKESREEWCAGVVEAVLLQRNLPGESIWKVEPVEIARRILLVFKTGASCVRLASTNLSFRSRLTPPHDPLPPPILFPKPSDHTCELFQHIRELTYSPVFHWELRTHTHITRLI